MPARSRAASTRSQPPRGDDVDLVFGVRLLSVYTTVRNRVGADAQIGAPQVFDIASSGGGLDLPSVIEPSRRFGAHRPSGHGDALPTLADPHSDLARPSHVNSLVHDEPVSRLRHAQVAEVSAESGRGRSGRRVLHDPADGKGVATVKVPPGAEPEQLGGHRVEFGEHGPQRVEVVIEASQAFAGADAED